MSVNGLGPYPAYRESGVEWLGRVPDHWEISRLGALLQERGELNSDGKMGEVLSLLRGRGVIPYSQKGNIGNKKSDDTTRYKLVRPDDIVVNSMNVIIGSVGLSRYTGCLSPVYYVLKTRRLPRDHPRYLDACFQTKRFQRSLVRLGNGILAHRMRIPMELLKCEPLPRPPHAEQTAIARFLDAADRRIRRYIRAKERLIELLQERKRALIHEAVTGRTDVQTGQPYPAYKDSGVEWLGKVPKHWEVRRNKSMLSRRKVLVGEDHPEFDLLSLTKGGVIIRDLSTGQGKFSADPGTCQEVRVGDLVFCLFDVPETPRTVGLSGHHGMITGAYTVLECPDRVLRRFLEAFYIAMDDRKLLAPLYSGLRNTIPPSSLLRARSPVPPLPEQRAIVRFLEAADRRIRRHISATKRQITLLREYRTRLIADVVTGKLDVREASARLPEMDPLSADRNRAETIPTESNLHSTADEIAKEASA